jgi:UDP-galactopyranose mutase
LRLKKNDKQIHTFTKKWVSRLLWFGCIWISWSYILASFDRVSIAEALSETVAKVIIATILGYLLKAFFETYSEKKNKLKEKELLNSVVEEVDDVVFNNEEDF